MKAPTREPQKLSRSTARVLLARSCGEPLRLWPKHTALSLERSRDHCCSPTDPGETVRYHDAYGNIDAPNNYQVRRPASTLRTAAGAGRLVAVLRTAHDNEGRSKVCILDIDKKMIPSPGKSGAARFRSPPRAPSASRIDLRTFPRNFSLRSSPTPPVNTAAATFRTCLG